MFVALCEPDFKNRDLMLATYERSVCGLQKRAQIDAALESPRPYMQPTDLKAIARDAALRGDTKTLFHTLDLLERLVPIAAFMDFCTELDELRLQGEPPRPH
jgi:hypothetical protein